MLQSDFEHESTNIADRTSLATSLLVPAVCYVGIIVYGILAARGLGLKALVPAAGRVAV